MHLLKEGEGIGTSATRAAIIEELKRMQYLALKGKFLIATPFGRKLLQNLPDMVKNPVLTAVFESKLKDIALRKLALKTFEQDYVVRLVKSQGQTWAGLLFHILQSFVKTQVYRR